MSADLERVNDLVTPLLLFMPQSLANAHTGY